MANKPLMFNMLPWCNCIQTGKWLRQDGYKPVVLPKFNKDGSDLATWAHSRCGKLSKMNYDRLKSGLDCINEDGRNLRYEEDIVAHEARLDALKEITAELGWDESEEEWEGFPYDEQIDA